MKNIKLFLPLLLIVLTLVLSSCVDDNSMGPVHDIKGVKIDTTGMSSITILKNKVLTITPDIKTTLNPSRLKYKWRVNLKPNNKPFIVIGKKKKLTYKVKLRPNSLDEPYQLELIITDKKPD